MKVSMRVRARVRVRIRVRIRSWVRFTGRMGLPLELWSVSNVRASVRLRFWANVICG